MLTGRAAARRAEASQCRELPALSRDRPLVVDRSGKRVLIYTEVNPENIEKKNPHWGIVADGGKLASRGILRAFCKPVDFHDGLVAIGAHPGNNLTESSTGRCVAGDRLIVSAGLPGVQGELTLGRIFRDSSGKGFSIRFGGNRKASEEEHTGCITCLESCWVGITSNAAYPLIGSVRRFLSPNSLFSGNPEFLSSEGNRTVILSYRVG